MLKSALTLGCIIVKSDMNTRKVVQSTDISIVTKDCFNYYFYLPSAGPLKIKKYEECEMVDRLFNETGNAVIEAGYSRICLRFFIVNFTLKKRNMLIFFGIL